MIRANSTNFDYEPSQDAQGESRMDSARSLKRSAEIVYSHRGPESLSIFFLRYRDGKPIRTIATQLGKSPDAVKASLRRARLAIMKHLPSFEKMRATVS